MKFQAARDHQSTPTVKARVLLPVQLFGEFAFSKRLNDPNFNLGLVIAITGTKMSLFLSLLQ